MKRGDKNGQRLLYKKRRSRLGPFSLEKTLLRKQVRELLKTLTDVETLTGNYVHCLTDTGTTNHQVTLLDSRFKTRQKKPTSPI